MMNKGTSIKITMIGTAAIICASFLTTPSYHKNNEELKIKNITKFLEYINQEELAHNYQKKQFTKQLERQGFEVISCEYGNYNEAKSIRKYENFEIGYQDYGNGQIVPYLENYDEVYLPLDITYTDWNKKSHVTATTTQKNNDFEKYVLKDKNELYEYERYTRDGILKYNPYNDDIIFDSSVQIPGYEMEYISTNSNNEKEIKKVLYYTYSR